MASALHRDPRWKEFALKYAFNIPAFMTEVLGASITWQQNEFATAVSEPGCRVAVSSGHGCFGIDTEIMRADGSVVAVQDVSVGDKLMGPDGQSVRNVLELKRGRESMYRFTYMDGTTSHVFNESHILCLVAPGKNSTATVREWLDWTQEERESSNFMRLVEAGDSPRYMPISILAVEALGEGDYFGFVLDGDSRFLGGDFTVLHNTGKTFSLGAIALWHMLCYYHSNTVITAPKLDQVRTQVWQEIADQKMRLESGKYGWIAQHIVLMGESVYIKGMKESWWIKAQTAPKGSPENLAGKHRDWLLWLCDEASGIPDANFGVINGSLSDARNRLVMTSQPTRPSGYFYNSHHENNKANGGNFTAIVMDSEESPLVSPESILRWRKEYGGKDSAMYGIKVLGRFPDKNDGMLLAKSEIERAFGHTAIPEGAEYGRILVADVGEGVYRDESALGLFHVSGYGEYYDDDARHVDLVDFPIITNARDPVTFAGDIYAQWLNMTDAVVYVDAGGVGATVAKILENKGVPVVRIKWGAKCFKNKNKDMYVNQRAHCTYSAAEAIKKGRFGLADGPWKTKLTTQASRIPYFFDEKAIVHITSKEKMREDGIPSPDLFDVVCMALLEGSHYTPLSAGEGVSLSQGAMNQAQDEAESAFADVK